MPLSSILTADTALGLLDALGKYSALLNRELELILRPDGSGELMAAEEFTLRGDEATGFEMIEDFESIEDLEALLDELLKAAQ